MYTRTHWGEEYFGDTPGSQTAVIETKKGGKTYKFMYKFTPAKEGKIFETNLLREVQGIIPTQVFKVGKDWLTVQPLGKPLPTGLSYQRQEEILKQAADKGFFYADIKPANFVFFPHPIEFPRVGSSQIRTALQKKYDREIPMHIPRAEPTLWRDYNPDPSKGVRLIDLESFQRVPMASTFRFRWRTFNRPFLQVNRTLVPTTTDFFLLAIQTHMRRDLKFALRCQIAARREKPTGEEEWGDLVLTGPSTSRRLQEPENPVVGNFVSYMKERPSLDRIAWDQLMQLLLRQTFEEPPQGLFPWEWVTPWPLFQNIHTYTLQKSLRGLAGSQTEEEEEDGSETEAGDPSPRRKRKRALRF